MRHFQEFLLAIDIASFGEVYISQWNTQGKTPVGFQVLFPEINWKEREQFIDTKQKLPINWANIETVS